MGLRWGDSEEVRELHLGNRQGNSKKGGRERLMFTVHRILCPVGEKIGVRVKTVYVRKELIGIWSQQPWVISRPRAKALRLSATWAAGKLSRMISSKAFRSKGMSWVPARAPTMMMLVKMGEP